MCGNQFSREGEIIWLTIVICLERIEQFNPKLNAFITVTADQQRQPLLPIYVMQRSARMLLARVGCHHHVAA
jgi:Asp-tRNA(Asn)/Glu-tRNA(Gln) amidotransferase A subunit family amidase